ncbi:MAG: hypothetical protein WKF73_07255 [Nocardioidaceae bacterium]
MQWDDGPAGGFSTASDSGLSPEGTARGRYGRRGVNVRAQQRDPDSLFSWFSDLIATLRECPEIGVGQCTVLDVPLPRAVLAHRFDAPEGSILLLHNLAEQPATLDIGRLDGVRGRPFDMLGDAPYERPSSRLTGLQLRGFGYRWIRLRRSSAV